MGAAHHRAAINTMAAARIAVEVKKPSEARRKGPEDARATSSVIGVPKERDR